MSVEDRLRSSKGARRVLIALIVLAGLVTGAVWSFASPPGSSPDEDFHGASIWCPMPIETSGCTPVRDSTGKIVGAMVPQAVASASLCYAFKTQESGAGCLRSLRADNLLEINRLNLGLYPGGYYSVAHLFVGPDVSQSFLRIRLFNVSLTVALLGSLIALAPVAIRRAFALSWLAALIPLGIFLIGSVNPSAWAMTGVAGTWMGLTVALNSPSRPRAAAAGVLALVAAGMAAGARSDAGAYVVLVAIVTAWLASAGIRQWRWRALFPALIVLMGVWSYFSSTQTNLLQGTWTEYRDRDPMALLINNIQEVPTLLVGMVGASGWGLGWLDTPMPSVIGISAVMVVSGIIFSGLRSAGWRKTLGFLAVAGALVALPMVTLQASSAYVGELIQPRYMLPLLPVLLGVCLLAENPVRAVEIGRLPRVLIVVLLSGAHALALMTNMRRYLTGLDDFSMTVGAGVEWWWQGPIQPSVVFVIGALAFPVLMLAILVPLGAVAPADAAARQPDAPAALPAAAGPVALPPVTSSTPSTSATVASRQSERATAAEVRSDPPAS